MPGSSGRGGQELKDVSGLVEGLPVVEPAVELGSGDGPGHEVPLGLVAAHPGQLGVGASGLNALGDDTEAKTVRQLDGGGNQGGGAGVMGHGDHEGVVELDLVDGQVAQIRQRAVTGAEVVDGDPDTDVAQTGEDDVGQLAVDHEEPLRDLQLEGAR